MGNFGFIKAGIGKNEKLSPHWPLFARAKSAGQRLLLSGWALITKASMSSGRMFAGLI